MGDRLCIGEPTHYQRGHAALLSWPDATLCLGTAARLHGLPVTASDVVDVLVTSGRPRRGLLVPHQFPLEDGDVCRIGLLPATTRRRTIIDCLGRLPGPEVDGLVAWVVTRRLLTASELEAWLVRNPRAWGNTSRRAALTLIRAGAASRGEAVLHDVLRAGGITGWLPNEDLFGHIGVAAAADVYFPAVRLVVEFDGRGAHGAVQFQRDRDRQNLLVAAGCTVLRFTWYDVTSRPGHVVREISACLARLQALPLVG